MPKVGGRHRAKSIVAAIAEKIRQTALPQRSGGTVNVKRGVLKLKPDWPRVAAHADLHFALPLVPS
jgi:hypothetical protein